MVTMNVKLEFQCNLFYLITYIYHMRLKAKQIITIEEFKEIVLKYFYFSNDFDMGLFINNLYSKFIEDSERVMVEADDILSDFLERGIKVKNIDDIDYDEVKEVLVSSIPEYFNEFANNTNLLKDGYTLKSNLLNRACKLNNTDKFGYVYEIPETKNHLIVDFGDNEPIKVSIHELTISGHNV